MGDGLKQQQTCKCCRRQYKDEDNEDGRAVPENGTVIMWYPSRYDMNIYQFTLAPGWYCYECLEKEVKEGLCQPLVEWKDIGAAFRFFYPTDANHRLILGADGDVDVGHHDPEMRARLKEKGVL